jgi:hypothetical protein
MARPRILKALVSPPILSSESAHELQAFRQAVLGDIRPRNTIERIYVGDYVEYAWEIWRLRRAKTAIMNHAFRYSLQSVAGELLKQPGETDEDVSEAAEELAREWYASPSAKRRLRNCSMS